jgi:hypothetical protein
MFNDVMILLALLASSVGGTKWMRKEEAFPVDTFCAWL